MKDEELKTLKSYLNIESGLTEEMLSYISRKTGVKMNVVRMILDTESEYTAKCLKLKGRVNVLGKFILTYQEKGDGKYYIRAKAPKRLYNAINNVKDKDIDIETKETNMALKQITYIE